MAGATLMVPGDGRAVDVTVTITGEVVIPPCTVNNNQTIEVDFGNIPVTDIGNAAFRQKKSVPVSCTYFQGTPYVKVSGSVLAGGVNNVLATSVANFGIALYQGDGTGTPMVLGSGSGNVGYPVTSGLGTAGANNAFTFTAAPYRKAGAPDPEARAFTATASMSIIYM
ncbi:TPA: fimbrial protein [Salmonella enterica subsp. salamae serovar 56:l,v:z39]|nr:fimbrial protein [Salmonella enterica subsp. salamae serovar 56:l,v:z39]